MSIVDLDKVDAMGLSQDGKRLCLFIADVFNWEDEDVHLDILQDKINAYVSFLEGGQWKSSFPQDLEGTTIQIDFLYEITPNCEKFLQAVQDQLGQYCIEIKVVVVDEDYRKRFEQQTKQPKPKRKFPFFWKK